MRHMYLKGFSGLDSDLSTAAEDKHPLAVGDKRQQERSLCGRRAFQVI